MTTTGYITKGTSLGFKTKRLRVSLRLSQHELATLAGVLAEEVDLLEENLPVELGTKLKILRVIWARKENGRQAIFR
jgi:DNA-binding transcriptional regulator YiaG